MLKNIYLYISIYLYNIFKISRPIIFFSSPFLLLSPPVNWSGIKTLSFPSNDRNIIERSIDISEKKKKMEGREGRPNCTVPPTKLSFEIVWCCPESVGWEESGRNLL